MADEPLPVGLITATSDARLVRRGTTTRLHARNGDVLFPGDRLEATGEREALTNFVFCPQMRAYQLRKGSLEIGALRIRRITGGYEAPESVRFCDLPRIQPGTMANFAFHVEDLKEALRSASDQPPANLTAEQRQLLDELKAAIEANPANLAARTSYAVRLERFGLLKQAIDEYGEIGRRADGAVWSRAAQEGAATRSEVKTPSRVVGGTTYAVLVGENLYPHLPPPNNELSFAENDAEEFYKHVIGPRAGVPPGNVTLLLHKKATVAAVRHAIETAFSRAKESDTVLLYVAAHGIAPDHDDGISKSYLLAYDSDDENLGVTALPMKLIQDYLHGRTKAHEVRVFIDACKSGRIASIENAGFGGKVRAGLKGTFPSDLVVFLASRSREVSYECKNYQHGAFTYFVLRGLETNEAADSRGKLTADALVHYVTEQVHTATGTQTPTTNPNLPGTLVLRRDGEQSPAMTFGPEKPGPCEVARGRVVSMKVPETTTHADYSGGDSPFEAALRAGTLLPPQPGNALTILKDMQSRLSAKEYEEMVNRLEIELENAGQLVILEYLKGDSVTPRREVFEHGAKLFAAAHELAPSDDSLLAKELFCRGRMHIFDHNYSDALRDLETALRLDPFASYAYNAIGLAYLQQAQYAEAKGAFLDAIRHAPYWVYARHNLALTYTEEGEFRRAVDTYNEALSLTPRYAYVEYNLGLTLLRMNRFSGARDAFRAALALDPNLARAHTALGLSYALEGDRDKAQIEYDRALKVLQRVPEQGDELVTRHDLALLVAPDHPAAAIELWKRNLEQSQDDMPSLKGLARLYKTAGNIEEASRIYGRILNVQSGYVGARIELAELLIQGGKLLEADEILAAARKSAADNPTVWELSGDAWVRTPERARVAYETALRLSTDKTQRSRIRRKLVKL